MTSVQDIQAAVLKQAANTQGNQDPSKASQAVQQDLSIMADQAKGYTAGIQQGIDQGNVNSWNLNARLNEEKAAADYQRQLEMQAAQARGGGGGGGGGGRGPSASALKKLHDAQVAQQEAAAQDVLQRMRRSLPPEIGKTALDIIAHSSTFEDALAQIQNTQKYGGFPGAQTRVGFLTPTLNRLSNEVIANYARQYHSALQAAPQGLSRML